MWHSFHVRSKASKRSRTIFDIRARIAMYSWFISVWSFVVIDNRVLLPVSALVHDRPPKSPLITLLEVPRSCAARLIVS